LVMTLSSRRPQCGGLAFFLSLVFLFSACGKKLTVVTYDKKRGNKTSTTKHSEKYFDFDGKKTPARKASTSDTYAKGKNAGGTSKVVQTARSYIGTPYRYGGTDRSGMDCSGLLCASFESAGIKIPRSSYEQAEMGSEVRMREVAPGDLVFFSERKGGGKVSHVGLVTAVRGSNEVTFVHSSTSRGVIEDNLYAEHYQKIFVKAIRPF
jgi:probable lipoprotein NlpC